MERPKKPTSTMTDNERARAKGFLNFLYKRQAEAKIKEVSEREDQKKEKNAKE